MKGGIINNGCFHLETLLFIIGLLQLLSVADLFDFYHFGGRLQAVPVAAAASMLFLLFRLLCLFNGISFKLVATGLFYSLNQNSYYRISFRSQNGQRPIIDFFFNKNIISIVCRYGEDTDVMFCEYAGQF